MHTTVNNSCHRIPQPTAKAVAQRTGVESLYSHAAETQARRHP
ncbi:hypothetical protein [Nocardia coffeae]|nr:hypothetical protein [Nocardia coffeae]